MIVSNNTKDAEKRGNFFKHLGKKGPNVLKKLAKNVLSNPTRALDDTAKIAAAAVSINFKNVLSTLPEVISFYHTGKRLYFGKFVQFMLYEWNKKLTDYTHQHLYKKID